MPVARITKTSVDDAKPAARDWLLWDDKLTGYGLKVTPAGGKIFIYQYRMGGRDSPVRRFTIGKFGKLTPDGARKIAEGLAHSVAAGTDPQKTKVEAVIRSVDLAFTGYVERFAVELLERRWKATHAYAHSLLKAHAVPKLGKKAVHEITRQDISAVLAGVKNKPATAHNLYAVLRRLFRWAMNEGDIDHSPMLGMDGPQKPDSRDRVLADDELSLVWKASQKMAYPFGPLIRLLIVTGARRDEVAAMDWAELKDGTKIWDLPAERSKNGLPSKIMLSEMAIQELNALARRAGVAEGWPRDGLVFTTTGKTAVSGFSRAKRRLDKLVATDALAIDPPVTIKAWRVHDLRRTLATGLQRLGIRFEVTEAVLNHVGGSKQGVAGIYQRHDWADEKRAAVAAWAVHLNSLLTEKDETNVVQLALASVDRQRG